MACPMFNSTISGIAAIGLDIVVIEAVTGIDRQPQRRRERRRRAQPLELPRACRAAGLGIGAGVQLDHRRAGALRRLDLRAGPDR